MTTVNQVFSKKISDRHALTAEFFLKLNLQSKTLENIVKIFSFCILKSLLELNIFKKSLFRLPDPRNSLTIHFIQDSCFQSWKLTYFFPDTQKF